MDSGLRVPSIATRRHLQNLSGPTFTLEERESLWHLEGFLRDLDSYAAKFYYAVALFDMASENLGRFLQDDRSKVQPSLERCRAWLTLAARDGAMTVFHFAKTLDAVKSGVAGSKNISATLDHTQFRSIRREFREHFPNFEPVRHAVAHSGELLKDEKRRSENTFSGSFDGPGLLIRDSTDVFVSEMLVDRTFSNTFDGKIISYDLSWENWRVLDKIVSDLFFLFGNRQNSAETC